jgi:hypothetical protein
MKNLVFMYLNHLINDLNHLIDEIYLNLDIFVQENLLNLSNYLFLCFSFKIKGAFRRAWKMKVLAFIRLRIKNINPIFWNLVFFLRRIQHHFLPSLNNLNSNNLFKTYLHYGLLKSTSSLVLSNRKSFKFFLLIQN